MQYRFARAGRATALVVCLVSAVFVIAATPVHAQHEMATMSATTALPHNIPDFCAAANMWSVRNGAWSDPGTWSSARVPGVNDLVTISAGTSVTYDVVNDDPLTCVGVRGQLLFRTNIDTRLTVATLMVMDTGALIVGSAAAPIDGNVTAEIVIADRAIDTMSDPEQFGTGLIAFGTVTMRGAAKNPAFIRVSAEPRVGTSVVQLSGGVQGWRASDRIVIPDTRHLKTTEIYDAYRPQWEERQLAAVSTSQITLGTALAFDHLGARNSSGALEFLPHVANLSRNVVIRSQNPRGTRGHVLMTGRADVDIRYVSFRDLGRTTTAVLDSTTFDSSHNATHIGTNQIGRYSLHLHHLAGPSTTPANGYQFTVIGNAIEAGPKWGLSIHDSHYGLVQGNVFYNDNGAGLMTEDGSESYNVIADNFAIRGTGTGGRQGEGREGVGFYLRGPNNYVRNNVAANFLSDEPDAAYGYKYYFYYLGNIRVPLFRGADPMDPAQTTVVDGNALPILEFLNNEVYGATESGLTYWWLGTFGNIPRTQAQSVIKGLRVWNVYNKGIFAYHSRKLVIDGLIVRGTDPAHSACCGQAYYGADYYTDTFTIVNANVQGVRVGANLSSNTVGTQTIQDSFFQAYTNIQLDTMWSSAYTADGLLPRRTVLSNVRFADAPGRPSTQPYSTIMMSYLALPTRTLTQTDELFVFGYNGVAGDDFQVLYPEQASTFIVPQTILNTDGSAKLRGSPVSGLTNSQNWSRYGIAIAGKVAPCATTRPEIVGFVCLANMPPAPSGTFALSTTVTGAGAVTSSPAGVNCTQGTCTTSFPAGTALRLTAAAAAGWTFGGWSGACAGYGDCTVSMSSAQAVTAVFIEVDRAVLVQIDSPDGRTKLKKSFTIEGWAIDQRAQSGPGVDFIDIWAVPQNGAAPLFIRSAKTGVYRPDVGAAYGSQFETAGFNIQCDPLPAGRYLLLVYPHSAVTNAFEYDKVAMRSIDTETQPLTQIDTPASGATVGSAGVGMQVTGWAIDWASLTSSGIDAVHVWAVNLAGGAPTFLGAAATGLSRPDVGAAYGSRFASSGYALTNSAPLTAGTYYILVYSHSVGAATFNAAAMVAVTIR